MKYGLIIGMLALLASRVLASDTLLCTAELNVINYYNADSKTFLFSDAKFYFNAELPLQFFVSVKSDEDNKSSIKAIGTEYETSCWHLNDSDMLQCGSAESSRPTTFIINLSESKFTGSRIMDYVFVGNDEGGRQVIAMTTAGNCDKI